MLRKIIALCLVILLLFFINGCTDAEKIKSEEKAQEAIIDVSEDISDIADTLESINEDLTKVPEEKPETKLDDLQVVVCEEADKAGTCQTRLIEVGIVMPEECCEVLGKCC